MVESNIKNDCVHYLILIVVSSLPSNITYMYNVILKKIGNELRDQTNNPSHYVEGTDTA